MDVVREVQKESTEKLITVLQEMVKIKEFSDDAMKKINEYASNFVKPRLSLKLVVNRNLDVMLQVDIINK
jgi:hypothetical protein